MTDISEKPGHLIRRCHQISSSLFFQECEGSDLTPIQYAILSVLNERGELDQKTLAAAVSLDKSTAAETIRRLEKKGLIERRAGQTDRRARIVSLTGEGSRIVVALRANVDNVHNRLLEALDEHERPLFVYLLKKICSELEAESRPRVIASSAQPASRAG
ncbi:MarR family winged helix-turn-helix transcriptional regulator [Celeribacter indicus]|uniref:Transcription regulator MarR family protein n=1 Tax=Celeribacter indicus TaxID=1208324 RepID=A0A0B5DTM7_9RHOB|nr:MarR family transcriptional regulator [Celeribacter indicus]AJE46788.1 transcription regulator MarR family protein [Celeribacter indicus]SDX06402.1 transcriptional regulator, MarR family [Celeribacter indicus]